MGVVKTIKEWRFELKDNPTPAKIEILEKKEGIKTIRVNGLLYHSQYDPFEEAKRIIDSAELDIRRPVIVGGLGLGYHIKELLRRGFELLVIETNPEIVTTCINTVELPDNLLLAISRNTNELLNDETFLKFINKIPQPFLHPIALKLNLEFYNSFLRDISTYIFQKNRLNIAVIGPMYGGSLPIAKYLTLALKKLGHNAFLIDPECGWSLYNSVKEKIKSGKIVNYLEEFLTRFLSEWCYAQIIEFQPEICIALAQAPLNIITVSKLREKNIITAFWFVENWRHMSYWRDIAPFYDVFFHIQPGDFDEKLDSIGCKYHKAVLTGCDPDLHKPIKLTPEEEKKYKCDLSFAGAGYYNRIQILKGLTDYNLKIWGVNWYDQDLLPHVVEGEKGFDTEEYMKIVAGSKINLNIHSSVIHEGIDPEADAINPRVFEIASAGGFQLCDPCKGLERLFDIHEEIPTYTDLKSLREKINYYLEHEDERKQIAKNARMRALKEHTYQNRAQEMLEFLIENFGGKIIRKGIRIRRTIGEIIDIVGKDSILGQWLISLPQDIPFTQHHINTYLNTLGPESAFPEKIFWLMNEIRVFGEQLLKEKR
ncbi:MAG: glycosyltransferase [Candidatus Hydrogenedentes bacterium]|nr:glycosyltransferase [Candidatus Hydrogenedentota bacterium]